MNEKRAIRSVPSTDSNKHDRPATANAKYAEIGVIVSATKARVTDLSATAPSTAVTLSHQS